MKSSGVPPPVGPLGRPRDPALEGRILKAALAQMAEHGYADMSVDAVAAAAGVTKPTLYLRYKSKADLATAALSAFRAAEPPAATGRTRADLVTYLANFRRSLLRPNGLAMIGSVLLEEHRTPDLIARFRERVVAPRRAGLKAIFERGVAKGEVRRGADLDAAVNLLIGSFYARYLTGEGVPEDWPRRVVNAVWPDLRRAVR
jgi:AcrR family transcriptional regulator